MTTFRERLRSGAPLLGTFFKTPSPVLAEVLGLSGLDMVCIDAEHSPLDRGAIDLCVMGFRAAGLPALVRVPTGTPEHILNALDSGATGIVVPHVTTAVQAAAIVKMSHYGDGGRGFAGANRAGVYGTKPMADHLRDSAAETTVIVQIEDLAALDHLDEIATIDGIDGLFIGRMDLTVSLGCPRPDDPRVVETVRRICQTGRRHNRRVGMFTPYVAEIAMWLDEGASFYLLGSEHNFMLAGARALREEFAAAKAKSRT